MDWLDSLSATTTSISSVVETDIPRLNSHYVRDFYVKVHYSTQDMPSLVSSSIFVLEAPG